MIKKPLKEEEEKESTKSQILGVLVDFFISNHIFKEETFENVYTTDTLELTPTEQNVVDALQNHIESNLSLDALTEIVIENINPWKSFSKDKAYEKTKNTISKYIEYRDKTKGKIQVSEEMVLKAKEIAFKVISQEPTASILAKPIPTNSKSGTIMLPQQDLFFEYNGVRCKALLDIVEYKYSGNIIKAVRGIDLKTTSAPLVDFHKEFYKWGYDIQAAFYTLALKSVFPNSKVLPFQFIVVSTEDEPKPIIVEVEQEVIDEAINGNNIHPGIKQLTEDYKYYKNNSPEVHRLIAQAQHRFKLTKLGLSNAY